MRGMLPQQNDAAICLQSEMNQQTAGRSSGLLLRMPEFHLFAHIFSLHSKSQITTPIETDTFKECLVPNWGISMT